MSETARTYFVAWYRLDQSDRYFIWYNGGAPSWDDGVWVDAAGRAPTFDSIADVQAFAARAGIPLEPEAPLLHDLDVVARWLAAPTPTGVDCVESLAAWNLFGDVARAVGTEFIGDDDSMLDVYDKLFWGNNLPSMTPPGEHYVPVWDADETRRMAQVLAAGLTLFRAVMRPADRPQPGTP